MDRLLRIKDSNNLISLPYQEVLSRDSSRAFPARFWP